MTIDWANIFESINEAQARIVDILEDLPAGKVVAVAKLADMLGYTGDDARRVFMLAVEGMVNKDIAASDGIEVCLV